MIMENIPEEEAHESPLFPLFPTASINSTATDSCVSTTSPWLSNSSFTADLSVVNDAVASLPDPTQSDHEVEEPKENDSDEKRSGANSSRSYELLGEEGEESFESDGDSESEKRDTKKMKKRKRKSKESKTRTPEFGSRKSTVRGFADSHVKPAKDYYFDTHPDFDNLAYGSLYRMEVPHYKLHNADIFDGYGSRRFYRWNQKGSLFDKDGDVDALDDKLKSGGRYWSSKYVAMERHRKLKRAHFIAPRKTDAPLDNFIPLSEVQTSDESFGCGSIPNNSMVEESWEDEVLRRTREFNKLTRENPHNEKAWLEFAEFQDKVARMQPQKGVRLQTLEKKISILEKATEVNPDNEDLLLYLLKAYQQRDTNDVLVDRWKRVLIHHSGSYKLWREFLHVVQGDFSRFKVSEVRKMYAHAIEALSAACSKQFRQVHQTSKPSDPSIVQLELGLVDIYTSLCRFEWQAGYQELATALFQAEVEFSVFFPSLLLTEQSKQRLFEHFWNCNGARVGEEGALGWSTWLEKEEENRQRVMQEEKASTSENEGGWTGWSEPLSKHKEDSRAPENLANNDVAADDIEEDAENEDIKLEDDTEALLRLLGIDVDAGATGEVKDTSTWARWAEEELSRDCNQWMPVRSNPAMSSHDDGTTNGEMDENILREVLYQDVSEYLFSLSSEEARLSLVYQFIDFFGGKVSKRICTNSSSWYEKVLSMETLSDSILENLRRVHDGFTKTQNNSSGFSLEYLLGNANDTSARTEMMKFLRNATLLLLTVFPRNYILEEAILLAEELFFTRMSTHGSSVTPCRALAKRLLKTDRQDLLLCGVYACREAVFGNIDHSRRVFDMALSSITGLPLDLQFNAPLLYLWYAEAELANKGSSSQESTSRAVHILSCLGSGEAYSPFKCQPTSLQVLRAHQGYREKLKTVRSTWVRGVIDDQSGAIICSAALFEELTNGWATGIEVLEQSFNMVLPERRSQSYQLEYMFNYYVRMHQRHHKQLSVSKVWHAISQGLQVYPLNPELFNALVEINYIYTTSNKLRLMFDDYCHKKPSIITCLFALSFELSREGSQHRVHGLFERALANEVLRNSVVLWRCYIAYEIDIACNPFAAKRIFFRAIHACPWSKKLWLDGFLKLKTILSVKELSDLQEVIRDKELNVRTDIYEILLQDEAVV